MFAMWKSILFIVLSVIFTDIKLCAGIQVVPQQLRVPLSRPPSRLAENAQGHIEAPLHHKVLRQVSTRKLPPSSVNTPGACECMDYWECIAHNGQVYTYCGISDTEVCCFYTSKDNQKNSNDGINSVTDGLVATTLSSSPSIASVEQAEQFTTTGNGIRSNGFDTNIAFVTRPTIETDTTDVDYFFSLEDGSGDLKRIMTAKDNPVKPPPQCGQQIVNWNLDSKANFREWPWHVALLETTQDLYICGGTLISENKVVTAAHCVSSYLQRDAPRLKIRAGEYDVSTNDEPDPYHEVTVENIFIHPDFNNATLANDIAVVKLSSSLNYTSNIRPVCLASYAINQQHNFGSRVTERQCVVTGWGRISESSPFSIVLKEIVVPLWTHAECQNQLRKNFGTSYKLSEYALCAGERGHDACDGDGGGGLVCFDRGVWNLLGVVSFGIGCGRGETPGVYTRVPNYLSWINLI